METSEKQVPLDEAMEQVRTVGIRLALMHLAYARTLVEEHGMEKGRDLIIKAMMAYGKLVGERNKSGQQDLPWYGFHDKYAYKEETYLDTREESTDDFDHAFFKVYGCVLAKIFLEYDEPELGALYCYVDAAKSMAVNPDFKLIHTACEVCGDEFCAFDSVPTTEEERNDFQNQDPSWKKTDSILIGKKGDEE